LNNNTTISFHYNTTPVVPGQNTMHVPAGSFNCVCGPVLEVACTFTYQASTPTPTPTATATASSTCSICFTPTPTSTPTASPTPTATASPPSCVGQYEIKQIGGSIVPGTADIGNHSNDLVTTIPLPFSYTLYGTTFTSINLSSNGDAQFTTTSAGSTSICLPWSGHNVTIFPYWTDLRTDAQPGCSGYPGGTCGIYTSVSGSAPNRIFNIEWRTVYVPSNIARANFELRLYEGQTRFDVIYGEVAYGNNGDIGVAAGTQRDDSCFNQYFCNGVGGPASGGWTLVQLSTPSPTPTPTPTLPQPTATPSEPPCEVVGSQPACNNTVSTEVTDFTVYASYFINGFVQASDFTVNGTPANNASVGSSSIIFHFNASPLVQGQNIMHLSPGAFTCTNGRSVDEFMCAFTYQPARPTLRPSPTPRLRPTAPPRPTP